MLDLAISIDANARGTTVVETNRGRTLTAPGWPQDSDFQLIAFQPSSKTCEVIPSDQLAEDIAKALHALNKAELLKTKKPDWYRRLAACAKGRIE